MIASWLMLVSEYTYVQVDRFGLEVQSALSTPPSNITSRGNIVHFMGQSVQSIVTDPDFGIVMENAMTLLRQTEYCQARAFGIINIFNHN